MEGYAMNRVIPTAISIRYDGRRVLSLSSLKSSSGELVLLSIIAKTDNEIIDANSNALKKSIPKYCTNTPSAIAVHSMTTTYYHFLT
jgi:hypothetical protein